MLTAPLPVDERERIADLRALKILDTPAEKRFDRIVELTRRLLNVPIAFISLVDDDRQWFKSRCGIAACSTPRDVAFCSHAILSNEPLIVPDATLDPRFARNPLVTGEPHIRFYAGHPLKGPNGHNVGTLCMVDHRPRQFDEGEMAGFKLLASMAEHELNLVGVIEAQRELLEAKNQLVATQRKLAAELDEAARYVHSLLPEKIAEGPFTTDYRFVSSSQLGGDLLGYHPLDDERWAAYLLDVTGHGVSAALLSTSVYHALRRQMLPAARAEEPHQVLHALNHAFPMSADGHGKFFTLWYGVYHVPSRTLRYANAGHPPPILLSPNGLTTLDDGNLMIGVEPGTRYETFEEKPAPGSRLFLYSDGAFEVRNPAGQMLQHRGLIDLIARTARCEDQPVDCVLDEVRNYQGREAFDDDFSLLELRFN